MGDELRRNMALFPIGTVMMLSHLTARQIRYYEQHELIAPVRNEGNQRLFSFNDVERLLQIKELVEKGVNIAGIKQMLGEKNEKNEEEATVITTETEMKRKELTESQLVKMVKEQLSTGQRQGKASMIQGQLHRFFK